MIVEQEFKFLKLEQKERKITEETKNKENKYYYVLNVLDEENNPCKFFSFNNETNAIIVDILKDVKGFQDLLIKFELSFVNNIWNVKLLNIEKEY